MCLVTQSSQTLCDLMDFCPSDSSIHGDSPGKNTEVGCHTLLQGNLLNPGIKPRSPTLQEDSLLSELPENISIYFKILYILTLNISFA